MGQDFHRGFLSYGGKLRFGFGHVPGQEFDGGVCRIIIVFSVWLVYGEPALWSCSTLPILLHSINASSTVALSRDLRHVFLEVNSDDLI